MHQRLEVDGLGYPIYPRHTLLSAAYVGMHGVDFLLGEGGEILGLYGLLIDAVEDEGVVDVTGDDNAVSIAHYEVAVALEELLYRHNAEGGRENSVAEGGVTASDDVSEASELGLDAGLSLDLLGESGSVIRAYALGNEDDEVSLAELLTDLDLINDVVEINGEFGDNDSGCARGDACVERYITCAATHNLNDVTARVGLTGVAQLIYNINNRVHSGIVADSVIGRGNVIIDRAGNTYARKTALSKLYSTSERTVTANGNKALNTELAAGLYSLHLTFLSKHFRATV